MIKLWMGCLAITALALGGACSSGGSSGGSNSGSGSGSGSSSGSSSGSGPQHCLRLDGGAPMICEGQEGFGGNNAMSWDEACTSGPHGTVVSACPTSPAPLGCCLAGQSPTVEYNCYYPAAATSPSQAMFFAKMCTTPLPPF